MDTPSRPSDSIRGSPWGGGLTSDHNDSVSVGAEAAALVVSRVREVGPLDREAHEDVADRAIARRERVLLLQLVALALGHGHAILEPQGHVAHGHLARDGKAAPLPNHRRGNGRLRRRSRFASCRGKEGTLAIRRRTTNPVANWQGVLQRAISVHVMESSPWKFVGQACPITPWPYQQRIKCLKLAHAIKRCTGGGLVVYHLRPPGINKHEKAVITETGTWCSQK